MRSVHCEGTSVSQSYSNRIVRTVWYCKREAHMSQKFAFGPAQDKSRGMAVHRGVRVDAAGVIAPPSLWYVCDTSRELREYEKTS